MSSKKQQDTSFELVKTAVEQKNIGVITRFHKFSEFGWENIRFSHKHSLGMESIPIDEITSELPSIVTPDVKKVHLLRASGDNRAMIGLQEGKIFHVFFIAANFTDFYTHGNKK